MRVTFRADATPSIGAGHVMRSWALAEELALRGCEISWQGAIEVPWLSRALVRTGWSVSAPGPIEADLVVVDSYALSLDYRRGLLERGIPVVAIVDTQHQELGPGSLWVNPGPPMPLKDEAQFLNGPSYVLIRSEIRALRALRESVDVAEGLTFLLGGTDFAGLGTMIERLDLAGPVYAGPGAGRGGRVNWLPGGAELLTRVARSKLVVSAAGVSSWEMLYVGVPLALVLAADNQRGNYEWMTAQGWAYGLGSGEGLTRGVSALLAGELHGVQRIDGLGAARVAEAVLRL